MKESPVYCLKVMSPVHIGCDEVFEPTEFVVDEMNNQLISFDPITFLTDLEEKDRQRFSGICLKGTLDSILEIYKFVRGRKTEGKVVEVSSGFVSHYQKCLSLPLGKSREIGNALNKFVISRTAFNPQDNRPYVPGSAVKGAIRTAWLNNLAKRARGGKFKNASDLENSLLNYNRIENDPFRLVKVSDFMPIGGVSTRIVYAVNEKKKPSRLEAQGPYQILEVIEPGAVFIGSLSLVEPLKEGIINNPIGREMLLQSLSEFFGHENKRENDELSQISIPPQSLSETNGIWPIRVGRHSGAESLTIDSHRSIKIMKGKNKQAENLDHATTLWLASEESKPSNKQKLRPFGWSILESLTKEGAKKYWETEQGFLEGLSQKEASDPRTGSLPSGIQKKETLRITTVSSELWERATLTYAPNSETLTASKDRKQAFIKGKETISQMIPEQYQAALWGKKRKPLTATVKVNPKTFKIVEVKIEGGG
jgi:CRISPR-associated protein Csm5